MTTATTIAVAIAALIGLVGAGALIGGIIDYLRTQDDLDCEAPKHESPRRSPGPTTGETKDNRPG